MRTIQVYEFDELSEAAQRIAINNAHSNDEFAEEFNEVIETGIANIKETLLEFKIDVKGWSISKDFGPIAISLRVVRNGKAQVFFLTEGGLFHQPFGVFMPVEGNTESFTAAIAKLKGIAWVVINVSQAYTVEYVAEKLSANENLRFLGNGAWVGTDDLCPERDREHTRLIHKVSALQGELQSLERRYHQHCIAIRVVSEPIYTCDGIGTGIKASSRLALEARVGEHFSRVNLGVLDYREELLRRQKEESIPAKWAEDALRLAFEGFMKKDSQAEVNFRTMLSHARQSIGTY